MCKMGIPNKAYQSDNQNGVNHNKSAKYSPYIILLVRTVFLFLRCTG